VELLKQPQYEPLPVERQVLLLFMLTNRYFSAVNVEHVLKTANEFLLFIDDSYKDISDEIREKKVVSSELEIRIKAACDEFVKNI